MGAIRTPGVERVGKIGRVLDYLFPSRARRRQDEAIRTLVAQRIADRERQAL